MLVAKIIQPLLIVELSAVLLNILSKTYPGFHPHKPRSQHHGCRGCPISSQSEAAGCQSLIFTSITDDEIEEDGLIEKSLRLRHVIVSIVSYVHACSKDPSLIKAAKNQSCIS